MLRPTPAQVREVALHHVANSPYGLVDFRWNREAAVSLERLWRDMRARGVELVVYTPPYHPTAWEALHREARSRAALASTAAVLTRLAVQVGARSLDASDPTVIPCGAAEFYDMQHATPGLPRATGGSGSSRRTRPGYLVPRFPVGPRRRSAGRPPPSGVITKQPLMYGNVDLQG